MSWVGLGGLALGLGLVSVGVGLPLGPPHAPSGNEGDVRQGPYEINARKAGVGQMVPDFLLKPLARLPLGPPHAASRNEGDVRKPSSGNDGDEREPSSGARKLGEFGAETRTVRTDRTDRTSELKQTSGGSRKTDEIRVSDMLKDSKVLVLALTSATCPLTKRYGPTLAALEKSYAPKGVRFVFLNPSQAETDAEVRDMIRTAGFVGPYVRDGAAAIAADLKAETTTEVFVLDRARTLQYRGAVDDQYGIGFNRSAPREKYLVAALEAVLKGERPRVGATWAPGCVLEHAGLPLGPPHAAARNEGDVRSQSSGSSESSGSSGAGIRTDRTDRTSELGQSPEKVTYSEHISRLMQMNCVTCHRPGGVGPFRLDTYADVKDRAPMIKFVTDKGIMPPWFAADDPKDPHRWINDRRLTNDEKVMLKAWIDADMPEGDRSLLPLPLAASAEWEMGKPDAVYQVSEPLSVRATGVMEYENVVVDPRLTEDKWVQAIEVLPTAKGVVHHILVFAVDRKDRRGMGADFGGLKGFFGAYVPGNATLAYPDGLAKRLPKDTVFQFQIHYTPNGTATTDQPRIALKWAKEPPRVEMRTQGVFNIGIRIPPRVDNHLQRASLQIKEDTTLWSFMPHMHVRGKAFRYEVEYPDGRTELLLDVPRFDFNWQLKYDLAKPVTVPAGSRILVSAWYDNSDKNPANPNPNATVFFGDQTFDEMLIGYVDTSGPLPQE